MAGDGNYPHARPFLPLRCRQTPYPMPNASCLGSKAVHLYFPSCTEPQVRLIRHQRNRSETTLSIPHSTFLFLFSARLAKGCRRAAPRPHRHAPVTSSSDCLCSWGKARLLNVAGGSGPDPRLHALCALCRCRPLPGSSLTSLGTVTPSSQVLDALDPVPGAPPSASPRPPHLPRPALLASAFTSLPQKAIPVVPPQLGQVLPLSILGLPWTPPEAHHTIFFIFTLIFIGV